MCGADPSTAHSLRCALLVVRGSAAQDAHSSTVCLWLFWSIDRAARASHMAGAASPALRRFPNQSAPSDRLPPPCGWTWYEQLRTAQSVPDHNARLLSATPTAVSATEEQAE